MCRHPAARSLLLAMGLTLSFSFAATAAAGCKGKYIRATTAERFDPTPERLERGHYLVNQVMACGACHTGRAGGDVYLEREEQTDLFLAGGNQLDDPAIGRLHVPNITPHADGLGTWSDDEVLRAIRDGVHKTGRLMMPVMPFNAYQHLGDEDGKAIVAYLRSVPGATAPRARADDDLKLMPRILFTAIGVQMHRPAAGVQAPAAGDKLGRGRYIARVGACNECHSLTDRGPKGEDDPLYFAGSDVAFTDARLGKVWARNLTPDPETGLGRYPAADIKAALRDGKRLDGKRMAPPMSTMIRHYGGMSDDDLDALVAYIATLKPARHAVPEPELTAEARKLLGT